MILMKAAGLLGSYFTKVKIRSTNLITRSFSMSSTLGSLHTISLILLIIASTCSRPIPYLEWTICLDGCLEDFGKCEKIVFVWFGGFLFLIEAISRYGGWRHTPVRPPKWCLSMQPTMNHMRWLGGCPCRLPQPPKHLKHSVRATTALLRLGLSNPHRGCYQGVQPYNFSILKP